ncbi:MAG: hypothetical protein ACI9R7_001245 [Lysobacterales bacterium]
MQDQSHSRWLLLRKRTIAPTKTSAPSLLQKQAHHRSYKNKRTIAPTKTSTPSLLQKQAHHRSYKNKRTTAPTKTSAPSLLQQQYQAPENKKSRCKIKAIRLVVQAPTTNAEHQQEQIPLNPPFEKRGTTFSR